MSLLCYLFVSYKVFMSHVMLSFVISCKVSPRNFIVHLGFASVDNEFLGVTICSTTLSAMCYLYNVIQGLYVILCAVFLSRTRCLCHIWCNLLSHRRCLYHIWCNLLSRTRYLCHIWCNLLSRTRCLCHIWCNLVSRSRCLCHMLSYLFICYRLLISHFMLSFYLVPGVYVTFMLSFYLVQGVDVTCYAIFCYLVQGFP